MQSKVGTIIDNQLLLRAKSYCHQKHIPLSRLFNNALKEYLSKNDPSEHPSMSAVKSSFAAIRVAPALLKHVMDEDIDGI